MFHSFDFVLALPYFDSIPDSLLSRNTHVRVVLNGPNFSSKLKKKSAPKSLKVKVAVNTIVPRSPFFLFLYLKTQTVTHIRKNAVEYLRQWNGAICVIYNLCQRQNIR